MHPAIIIGTVRSLWTWLWGRYHVPQNVFPVSDATNLVKIRFYRMRVLTFKSVRMRTRMRNALYAYKYV